MRKLLSLIFGMALLSLFPTKAWCQEAYVWVKETVIDEWNHTTKSLIFCYDNERATREGATYDLNEGDTQPGWVTDEIQAYYSSITIEPSFQNARPTSTHKWFYNMCVEEEFTGISYLNTSEVTNMNDMFDITINFEMTLDLTNFDTSKVTDMSGMFRIDGYDYTAEKRLSFVIDVSSFDTSNVTNMDYMFYACSVKSVDVSNFNTSKVTLMRSMFKSCRYLESLDLSSFTFPNESWRADEFLASCSSLKELTIPSTARYFSNYSCNKVGTIDKPCHIIAPEGFNFGVDTSGEYFQWKNGYFTLNANLSAKEFYYYKTNEKTATLYYDDNEERLSDTDNVILVSEITTRWSWSCYDPIELIIIDPSAKEARPTSFDNMFSFRNLKNVEGVENLNTDNVTSMQCLFSYCSYLPSEVIQNIVDHLNTSKVIHMNYMFSHCTSLESLDLSQMDVSSIRTMTSMFGDCSNLTEVNFGNFNTSRVTVMDHIFDGCSSLASIDLSKFDTGEAYTMNYMFQGCSKLESLDISNFSSKSLYYVRNMFAGCSNLKNISIGAFNPGEYIEEVSQQYGEDIGSMSGMFSGCSNLEKLDLSTFTIPTISNKSERIFAGCTSLQELKVHATAEHLNSDACEEVGTVEKPCTIIAPDGFDFGTDTSGDYFVWKSGCFKTESVTPLVTLSNGDNDVPLSEYDGMTVDVELEEYNCQPEKWYSLCVPFDISNAQLKEAFGDDVDIQEMSGCTWDANTLTMGMNFNKVTDVLAGRPYLLRVTGDVETPQFNGVTINSDAPLTINFGNCEMTGVLNATPLPVGDKTYLFIINNQFYYPATSNPLPAMRCYFHLLGNAANANSVALNMEDDADGIVTVISDRAANANVYYSLQGVSTTSPRQGIFINNGRKVVIK